MDDPTHPIELVRSVFGHEKEDRNAKKATQPEEIVKNSYLMN